MTDLTITPLCSIFDLLFGILFILLGLSGLAVVITVEICYFRKGGSKSGKALQDPARSAQGK